MDKKSREEDPGSSFDGGYHLYAAEKHKKRVESNPQRLAYAVKLLKEKGITFKVCNETTTQINCYFATGNILTFYAGTGKIVGHQKIRGINGFVRLCKKEIEKGRMRYE